MGAFLDGDDDISLEEIKNQQNIAQSQNQPTINKFQNSECGSLPLGQKVDHGETSVGSCPNNSKNGLCPPLLNHRTAGGMGLEATSGQEALPLPVSALTLEFDKLNLQGLGDSLLETPNKNKILASRNDVMGSDSLVPPPAIPRLENNQDRTNSEVSEAMAGMSLDPNSSELKVQDGQKPVFSSATGNSTRGLFLSG